MAWIELHQALRTHKKTMKAVSLLKMKMLPEAFVGHLSCLWLWSIDNAPDGILPNDHDMIDLSSGCPKDVLVQKYGCPEDVLSFTSVLINCGFIDYSNDSLILHDWDEYTGKLILQREVDRVRKQEERAQKRADLEVKKLSNGRPVDIRVTSEGTQPNPTQPNNKKSTDIADSLFDEVWEEYAYKKDRVEAFKAWNQTAKARPEQTKLLSLIRRYVDYCKSTNTPQAHLSTWLRHERWLDDNTIPSNGQTKSFPNIPGHKPYSNTLGEFMLDGDTYRIVSSNIEPTDRTKELLQYAMAHPELAHLKEMHNVN